MEEILNAEEEVQAEALMTGNEFLDDEPEFEGDVDDYKSLESVVVRL